MKRQTEDTYAQLKNLTLAGTRVVHIASHEWERVQALLLTLSRELNVPLDVWSRSAGLGRFNERGTLDRTHDITEPMALLEMFHPSGLAGILLLEDFQPYLEPHHHQVIRWVRELCRLPVTPGQMVVLSTPQPGLPLELRKEVPTLELPLPDVQVLRQVCERVAGEQKVPLDIVDGSLLEAARGLTVMEAHLAYAQAAVERRKLDASAVSFVVREKARAIRQSQVLEYYEPDAELTGVGGLDLLKDWLVRRGRAFGSGARDYGLDTPKGVLLLGVQGCGKSLVAKAIAAEWRFPLLRFDLGKVFGGVVGQSEGNMRMALQVAQALAPCVLWIDEIEKGLAGIGSSDATDGGTTARVIGTFLTWMQEKREPVFVVATANRIEQLPPELLRKGRFDEIFFVDLPSHAQRQEILSIHLRRKERRPEKFNLAQLADKSVGYSGAELEEAVREGMFLAFDKGIEVGTEHLLEAVLATYPLSRTMRDEIETLRRWAEVRARPATRHKPESLPSANAEAVPRLRQEMRNPFLPEGSR